MIFLMLVGMDSTLANLNGRLALILYSLLGRDVYARSA